jgi:hypothetical protein
MGNNQSTPYQRYPAGLRGRPALRRPGGLGAPSWPIAAQYPSGAVSLCGGNQRPTGTDLELLPADHCRRQRGRDHLRRDDIQHLFQPGDRAHRDANRPALHRLRLRLQLGLHPHHQRNGSNRLSHGLHRRKLRYHHQRDHRLLPAELWLRLHRPPGIAGRLGRRLSGFRRKQTEGGHE